MTRSDRLGRTAVVIVVTAAALAWWLFLAVPDTLGEVLGVVWFLAALALGAGFARRIADRFLPGYNVAEVAVEGPITRDGSGLLPATPGGTPADAIVDAIERAEESGAAALLVKLNTPGGEVVPSDDIRRAARAFDGPTIAYAFGAGVAGAVVGDQSLRFR